MKTEDLIAEIVSLPVESRVKVADSVLKSLSPVEPGIERKWLDLAEKRLAEIRAGRVAPVPGEEVFARVMRRRQRRQ